MYLLDLHGCRVPKWPWASREATLEPRYVYSNPLCLRAPFLRGRNTAPDERREQHEHVLAAAHAATRAGREEHTHLKHPDHPARRDDELDNDHEGADDDDENGTVTQIMTDDV